MLKHPRLDLIFWKQNAIKISDYNFCLTMHFDKNWSVEWVYHPDATSNIEVTYDFIGDKIQDYLSVGLPVSYKFIWGFWDKDQSICKTIDDLIKIR